MSFTTGPSALRDAGTGVPVDDDTIFEAASLSKPVFAYAVLKLVDAGRLDLDAPLQKSLPGDYVEDPRLRSITARRALSHTTGFPNWRPDGQPLKIHFDPGERFSYSGEGFVYLQKAVENRTGETLEALARRLVFEPLRMTSSSYHWQDRFDGRKAMGHDAVRQPARPAPSRGGERGGHPPYDRARLRALPRGRPRRHGTPEGDGRADDPSSDPRGRRVPELRQHQADRAPLAGDRLGTRLGRAGDGRRPLDLALGRQRRQRLPLLRRRFPEAEARRRRLHQQSRRPRHHPGHRRGGPRRASPGLRVARLRALGLTRQNLVQGHPGPRRARRRRSSQAAIARP